MVMMIAVVRETVGRYFFASPTTWSLELNCYLLVAIVYLAATWTALVEGHVAVDILYRRYKGKTKAIADIIISVCIISFTAVVGWQGGVLAWDSFVTQAHSSMSAEWLFWPSQVLIPIGSFLLCLCIIGKIVYAVSSLRKGD